MRQLEGAVLSNASVTRSQERLQRLPYIEKVETETRRVEGAADLVDIDVTWRRARHRRSAAASATRSASRSCSMAATSTAISSAPAIGWRSISTAASTARFQRRAHRSVLHGGRRLALVQRVVHRARTAHLVVLAVHHPDLQRGLRHRLSTLRGSVFNFGLTYSHEDLATAFSSSTQLRDWVRNNGDYYFRRVGRDRILGTLLDTVEITGPGCTTAATARCFRRAAARIA